MDTHPKTAFSTELITLQELSSQRDMITGDPAPAEQLYQSLDGSILILQKCLIDGKWPLAPEVEFVPYQQSA